MTRRRGLFAVALLAALLVWASGASTAHAATAFSDWAAVVIAGDWHAHDGGPSEAFDNARRDVSRELVDAGFSASNIRQFSVRPERYPDERLMISDPDLIGEKLAELAQTQRGGCLLYFS